jgi:CRISPR-associated endonuclease/helicase Cas3
VFWREWDGKPSAEMPRPGRDELCRVPIGEFRDFLKDTRRGMLAHQWDHLNEQWVRADWQRSYPGQIYLLHFSAAGYAPQVGWNPKLETPVQVLPLRETKEPEANDHDDLSQTSWQLISEHTDQVCSQLDSILSQLPLERRESNALRIAGRWHDCGKAHQVFQNAIDDGQSVERKGKVTKRRERPAQWRGNRFVAKAPGKCWQNGKLADHGFWRVYERKHFRHELASALAVLQRPHPQLTALADDELNLVAYLVAAHHGKVRLSIRSLPEEFMPSNSRRFARGIWDDDELPATDLGDGVVAPSVKLSLEPMELGLSEKAPFAGQPSWAERMLRLRDQLGPFRTAYLEALLRAADIRASSMEYASETKDA